MSTVFNLVRLQFKLYSDENFSWLNFKRKIWIYLPILLCILTMAGLLLYSVMKISVFFTEAELSFEFVCIFFLIVQSIQFVLGITVVTNTLFGSENEDLLKLPVSGLQIFSAKAIYLYIHELIFSTIVVLPTLLTIAIFTGQSVAFYLMIIPVCFLFPIIPFCLAILFSIPATLIRKIFNNKFVLILLGSLIAICISYFLYIKSLELVLNLVFFNTSAIQLSPETINAIANFSTYLIPQKLLVNFLYVQDVGISLAIILFATFITLSLTLTCANKWYYAAFFKENDNNIVLKRKKSRLVRGGVFVQLVNKEFINIFRSVSYLLQFFALSASSPLMVYFCSKMSMNIGVGKIGEMILPGLVLLVLIMFSALSASFSASAITREGNKLYHMKTIPASISVQIAAKFFTYGTVSFFSIFTGCTALLISGILDIDIFALILVSCVMVSLGGICNSLKRDIKNPACADLGIGEMTVTNNNTIVSIAIGILISIVLGGTVIALCYSENEVMAYSLMVASSVLFAGLSAFRLFFRVDKSFAKIEA